MSVNNSMFIQECVAFENSGAVRWETFGSIDGGNTWGLISLQSQIDLYASIGYQWEIAVVGEDDPDDGSHWARRWYSSLEEAIKDNEYDFDKDSSIVSRFSEEENWREFWLNNFEEVGRSSPTGWPIYQYRG